MEWFAGDVGSAISAAKAKKAIFCVYLTGQDELSKKLMEMTENSEFSCKYKDIVCIKIEQGSTTFSQFSQIYPVLMVPSIFYINSTTGVDIEVTVTTGDEVSVLAGLDRALQKFNESSSQSNEATSSTTSQPQPTTASQPIAVEQQPAPQQQEQEVQQPSTSEAKSDMESRVSRAREMLNENVGNVGEVQGHGTPTSLEDRVSRARELMQQKKEEKEREEEEKEKKKELERRSIGRDVQEMQRKQEEKNLQDMINERKKDREEEKLAKARVQAQIEQDRADRAARYKKEKDEREERRKEQEKQALAEQAAKADRDAAERSSVSRLQFRLPDGRSRTQQFPADTKLEEVYSWVKTDLNSGFSRFSLSTTFPRRNLDEKPKSSTLRELQLAPSGTILVLPSSSGSTALAGADGSLYSFLLLLLSPFTFLWGLVSSFFNPPPSRGGGSGAASSQNAGMAGSRQPAAGPSGSGTRTDNKNAKQARNIGRISNFSDDDETNTYNGNSTQQM